MTHSPKNPGCVIDVYVNPYARDRSGMDRQTGNFGFKLFKSLDGLLNRFDERPRKSIIQIDVFLIFFFFLPFPYGRVMA